MKFFKLAISLLCVSSAAWAATLPFDIGLPSFEELFRTFPKIGESLVEVDIAKESYSVTWNIASNNKPPQLYSAPVFIPASWPRDLKKQKTDATFSFAVGSDGIPKDIKRSGAELHPDLERVGLLYLSKLRYSPAELAGGAVPCTAEVTLRFGTDSDEMK